MSKYLTKNIWFLRKAKPWLGLFLNVDWKNYLLLESQHTGNSYRTATSLYSDENKQSKTLQDESKNQAQTR